MSSYDRAALVELRNAVHRAADLVHDLGSTSPNHDREAVVDALQAALAVARDLVTTENLTGCERHPLGAVDPADGSCLICNTHKKRATPTVAPVIALPGHARPRTWSTPRALERAKATDDERLPGDAPACTSCGSLLDADRTCFTCTGGIATAQPLTHDHLNGDPQ